MPRGAEDSPLSRKDARACHVCASGLASIPPRARDRHRSQANRGSSRNLRTTISGARYARWLSHVLANRRLEDCGLSERAQDRHGSRDVCLVGRPAPAPAPSPSRSTEALPDESEPRCSPGNGSSTDADRSRAGLSDECRFCPGRTDQHRLLGSRQLRLVWPEDAVGHRQVLRRADSRPGRPHRSAGSSAICVQVR
jgi:hypothetical protein